MDFGESSDSEDGSVYQPVSSDSSSEDADLRDHEWRPRDDHETKRRAKRTSRGRKSSGVQRVYGAFASERKAPRIQQVNVTAGTVAADYFKPVYKKQKQDQPVNWCRMCQSLLDIVCEQLESRWFMKPVSTKKYPDYLQIVRNPITLTVIKRKLSKGEYKDILHFKSDVDLMFNNAKLYTPEPKSVIHRETVELQNLFCINFSIITRDMFMEEPQEELQPPSTGIGRKRAAGDTLETNINEDSDAGSEYLLLKRMKQMDLTQDEVSDVVEAAGLKRNPRVAKRRFEATAADDSGVPHDMPDYLRDGVIEVRRSRDPDLVNDLKTHFIKKDEALIDSCGWKEFTGECIWCRETFSSEAIFRYHNPCLEAKAEFYGIFDPKTVYTCSCSKGHPDIESLQIHAAADHYPQSYHCNFDGCFFITENLDQMKNHSADHRNGIEMLYKCCWPDCERHFKIRNNGYMHVLRQHIQAKCYPCLKSGCLRDFYDKYNLSYHMRDSH